MTMEAFEGLAQIEELSERNRRQRSPQIEAEIMSLREAAGKRICARYHGADVVKPPSSDLFPHADGLPEITAGELSESTLAAGLLRHGALLVRGLYSSADVAMLQQMSIAQGEAGRWAELSSETSAQTLFTLLELYSNNGLLDAVRPYLGEAPVIVAERMKLRQRRKGVDNLAAIPWHQDVNFYGKKTYAVNCWAAITSCGEDNPGLGIVPCRAEERIGWSEKDGIAPLNYGRGITDSALQHLTERHPAVYPVLQPGDALIFDEMTMHCTAPRPWKQELQTVTISWFFRASGFPDLFTPLAV
jgi:hypothetical protein